MEDKQLDILLVDDDDVDVMVIQRAFAKARITNKLFIARDGAEALQMLRDNVVPRSRRLVLLDVNMPRMNGIEFLREVRSDPTLASLMVVVLTGASGDRDRLDAYQLNVAGYLRKPVTFDEFAHLAAALNKYWILTELP